MAQPAQGGGRSRVRAGTAPRCVDAATTPPSAPIAPRPARSSGASGPRRKVNRLPRGIRSRRSPRIFQTANGTSGGGAHAAGPGRLSSYIDKGSARVVPNKHATVVCRMKSEQREIEFAIEVFVRGHSAGKSRTFPYEVSRIGPLWVMRDAPRRNPRDYRKEEWIAHHVDARRSGCDCTTGDARTVLCVRDVSGRESRTSRPGPPTGRWAIGCSRRKASSCSD